MKNEFTLYSLCVGGHAIREVPSAWCLFFCRPKRKTILIASLGSRSEQFREETTLLCSQQRCAIRRSPSTALLIWLQTKILLGVRERQPGVFTLSLFCRQRQEMRKEPPISPAGCFRSNHWICILLICPTVGWRVQASRRELPSHLLAVRLKSEAALRFTWRVADWAALQHRWQFFGLLSKFPFWFSTGCLPTAQGCLDCASKGHFVPCQISRAQIKQWRPLTFWISFEAFHFQRYYIKLLEPLVYWCTFSNSGCITF